MDDREQEVIYEAEVVVEESVNATIMRGFKVGPEIAGGEYLIKVESNDGRFPVTYRKIRIRSYQDRKYIVSIDFNKETYTPGDIVRARVLIKRLDKQPLPNSNQL